MPNSDINNSNYGMYFGRDEDLFEAVKHSVRSKFNIEMYETIPTDWPEAAGIAFVELDVDNRESVLKTINDILVSMKGITIYGLISEKNVDYLIEASRYGVQGFIECPEEVFNILSILQKQERLKEGKTGNVSSFFSLKGGVGTTALSTNIAAQLTQIVKGRTVLVDMNTPLGDTALYLNMENEPLYSLTDFVYNINRFDEDLIQESLNQHRSGLYLLSLPSEVTELDTLNGDMVKSVIHVLRRFFDHVVIDCASDLSELTLSCLDESDNIVLVTEPSLSSIRAVYSMIQLSQKLGYPKEVLKLVVNRANSSIDEAMLEVIHSLETGTPLIVDNDFIGFNDSQKSGLLIAESRPNSNVTQQLHSIAYMLHNGTFMSEIPAELIFKKPKKTYPLLTKAKQLFMRGVNGH